MDKITKDVTLKVEYAQCSTCGKSHDSYSSYNGDDQYPSYTYRCNSVRGCENVDRSPHRYPRILVMVPNVSATDYDIIGVLDMKSYSPFDF